jgi:hypothetical protein
MHTTAETIPTVLAHDRMLSETYAFHSTDEKTPCDGWHALGQIRGLVVV